MARLTWLAAGCLVVLTLASPAMADISSSSITPYEATDRYNVLPWWFTLDKLFAFAVAPMKIKPTNTKTYTGYPQWPFLGGPGYLIAIKFSDSPIGAYNEIFFIPGIYKPKCSFKPYFSVQRIWVDSMASRHAGRSIWGIPKEMATFDWRESARGSEDSWTSLTLTDNASGKVAFRANMTDLDLGPEISIPSWLLPSNVRKVVQWPIDDSFNTFLANEEAFAATNISKYTNMKAGTGMRPVLTELTFTGEDAQLVKVSDMYVDRELFTGSANNKVKLLPLGLHLKEGTKASLKAPQFIKTCL